MSLLRFRRMITLKTPRDIEGMRAAAVLVGEVLTQAARMIRPGLDAMELDRAAEDLIRSQGARPAFKGYGGNRKTTPFPSSLCISINDVVVHGVPTGYHLQEGDIISVDCGVELHGYYGDYAYTFPVGEISEEKAALLRTTKQSLYEGIRKAVAGNRIGDIAHAVQHYCESRGYGVVKDLVGHGIGTQLHEDPQVPNVGKPGNGKKLKEGMTLCIEPMINAGTADVVVDGDGWTVRTADGRPAAHFEHTVLIKRGGAEVLSSFAPIEAVLAETYGESLLFTDAALAPAFAH